MVDERIQVKRKMKKSHKKESGIIFEKKHYYLYHILQNHDE